MQEYYDSQYDSQVKSEIEDKLLETSEVKKYPDGAVMIKFLRSKRVMRRQLKITTEWNSAISLRVT